MIVFEVVGIPGPQGSKRHVGNGVMIESSKKVKPWRDDVRNAAQAWLDRNGNPPLITEPVVLSVTFCLPRPKSRKKDIVVPTTPDLSKLIRSTEDALTGVLWKDDALVVEEHAYKFYADHDGRPGASIVITKWVAP
jgi:crossover junction endodeoxyribonuclease RusA